MIAAKGQKIHFLRRKLNTLWGTERHKGTLISWVKHLGLSIPILDVLIKNYH
jgi:hypothetical protein